VRSGAVNRGTNLRVLVTVKAYPNPSRRVREASCAEEQPERTTAELASLGIRDLFAGKDRRPPPLLEKIPYTFRYRFRCADCRTAEPHQLTIVDWELMQFYRRMREASETVEDCLRKVRDKWLDELCSPSRDTHYFVGNMRSFPASFLVLGVFWPPKELRGALL